jgi:hypothetical protein
MHFYSVPLGGKSISAQLGSIEFAKGRKLHVQKRLMGASIGAMSTTSKTQEVEVIGLPMLDVCTMNPPFSSSRLSNLLFGGVGQEERTGLQAKLGKVIHSTGLNASATAGLGSVFFAIGMRVTKTNGMLAFVLPRTVLNGEAWKRTQQLMRNTDIECVIVSHEFRNWNFSENTNLSEALIVTKKVERRTANKRTVFINLWKQPRTAIEAVTVTRAIKNAEPARLEDNIGTCELRTNGNKYGEMISLNLSENRDTSWAIPVAFAQTDLCRSAYYFSKGKIFLPRLGEVGGIKLVNLNEVAVLGPDGRDIYDGFSLSPSETPYPAFWGYEAPDILKLTQETNQFLAPLSRARPRRHRRNAQLLWSRAGTLMLPKELRLNTDRLCAVVLPSRALSNVWWPTRWRTGDEVEKERMERELALWYNSTLGVFTILMQRQETEGPWCKFPKAWFERLPTLDLRTLSEDAHNELGQLWESVSESEFLPIGKIAEDTVRKKIDAVFVKILGIPQLDDFRDILGKEPLIRGTQIS